MDRGSLAHDTDANLVTNPTLTQKLHSAVETRQVSHEGPEPRAVNCVLENLDMCGLGEVLPRRSTCPHQPNGTAENAVRKIESSAKTCDCVLLERFGCK